MGTSTGITIEHLAEDDPKTQLAQVVANSVEFHAFEYRLQKRIKSYRVYVDHFENGQKIETQLAEASLIEERTGLFFFNLCELATAAEEEEAQNYLFTSGSFAKNGSSSRSGSLEKLENYLIIFDTRFELDKNGTYPLLAFKQTNKSAETIDDIIISLREEFLYEPEAELKRIKDLSKILLYRVEFREKDLLND